MSKIVGFKQKYFSSVRAKTDFFIFRSWTIKLLQALFWKFVRNKNEYEIILITKMKVS